MSYALLGLFPPHVDTSTKPIFAFKRHGDPGLVPAPKHYRIGRLTELWKMSFDQRAIEFQIEERREVECFTTKQVFKPRWTELDVARNVEPSHPCKLEEVYKQWALRMDHDMSIRHAAAAHYKGTGVEERAAKRRAVQVTTASVGAQTVSPPTPERMRATAISEGKSARGN